MTDNDLYQLIKECIRNNRLAQERLYKYYYEDMFCTCQRYTEDAHDALSILNDAFLKVFLHISQYKKEAGNFKAWLKTIVINTAIDYTRRCKKQIRLIHIDSITEQGNDDFTLHYNWNQEELLQHFKQLPAVTRVVINLFAFDGYSHRDIAAQLNITETTSRWHLAEARKRLKNALQLQQPKMAKYE